MRQSFSFILLHPQEEWHSFNIFSANNFLLSELGRIPYFLLVNNHDFEYFACLHSPLYKNGDTTQFITKTLKYKSLNDFKADEKVYYVLNSSPNNKEIALSRLKHDKRATTIQNQMFIKSKGIEIIIKNDNIQLNPDTSVYQNSNIIDLFNLIFYNL